MTTSWPELQDYVALCTQSFGSGHPSDRPWACSVLAEDSVVYRDGRFGRDGGAWSPGADASAAPIRAELERFASKTVGFASDADDPWFAFVSLAHPTDPGVPEVLDEAWARTRLFGGTLSPREAVVVEPLEERGLWWERAAEELPQSLSVPEWREVVRCLDERGYSRRVFVHAGFADYEPTTSPGCHGSVLLRLACGVAANGDVAGLLGRVVWT